MTFLFESRISDVEKKYQSWIELNPDTYDYVVSHDPSGNQKYLDWVIKTLMNTYSQNYDHHARGIMKVLTTIHQNIDLVPVEQRDINRVVTFEQLNKILDGIELKIKDREAIKNSIKIYEDDQFLVVKPESYEASCKYGRNSKWCISGNNLADGPRTWLKYTAGEGKEFIFVINKKTNISTQHSRFNRLAIVLSTVENDKTHFNWFMEVFDALDQSMLNGYNALNELSLILPEKVISSIKKFINDKNADASKKYYDKIANGFDKIANRFMRTYPQIGNWKVISQETTQISYGYNDNIIDVIFDNPITYKVKIKTNDIGDAHGYRYRTNSGTKFDINFDKPLLQLESPYGNDLIFSDDDKIIEVMIRIAYGGFINVRTKVEKLIKSVSSGVSLKSSKYAHTRKKGSLLDELINFIETYHGYKTRSNFFRFLIDRNYPNPKLKAIMDTKGISGLRGHYSVWFTSVLDSGIIETKKVRTDEGKTAYVYVKGPNFDEWSKGKLVYY